MSTAVARVTEAEFLALPETMEKVELLDGEVVASPSPSYWHQDTLGRVAAVLREWADGRRDHGEHVTVGQSPLDVRFGSDRILQPDAFVLFQKVSREHQGPIDAIPEICIEVLSTNRAYDRVTKRFIYGEAGVQEYWLLDPEGFIECWSGTALRQRREVRGRFETALLPGFSVDTEQLLGD